KHTIYGWINDRSMLAHKIGRLWKFKASEVDEWVRTGGAATTDELEKDYVRNTKKSRPGELLNSRPGFFMRIIQRWLAAVAWDLSTDPQPAATDARRRKLHRQRQR